MLELPTVNQKFSPEEIRKRAFLRVARILYEHWEEGTGAHSRLFETLIPDSYILVGKSVSGAGWREHVAPCSVIRDRCIQFFEQGKSVEYVAAFVEAHLKLAIITREERQRLDFELGLKHSMPDGWEEGDIIARLREAGFVLASDVGNGQL